MNFVIERVWPLNEKKKEKRVFILDQNYVVLVFENFKGPADVSDDVIN